MGKMIDIDLVKSEVERLKSNANKRMENIPPIEHPETIDEDFLKFINRVRGAKEDGLNVQVEAYEKVLSFLETLQEPQEPSLPTIKGWVARDKVENDFLEWGLCVHREKPIRENLVWSTSTLMFQLPYSMFPELKWEDEPIEVELTIRTL